MNTPMSTNVVFEVAAARECEPIDLPPLHSAIDPDALDALFETNSDDHHPDRAGATVRFPYAGTTVCIESNGEIVIETSE